MSQVDVYADGVLSVLLAHNGKWTDRPGRVLASLASEVAGYDVIVGEQEYHWTSRAVLALEEMTFITVTRMYEARKGRANIVLKITLNDD